jgi:hypothetical protein
MSGSALSKGGLNDPLLPIGSTPWGWGELSPPPWVLHSRRVKARGALPTLGRAEHVDRFSPEFFDDVVVDEFHHAAAPSYRRLLRHCRPEFLPGLTATPNRTDRSDILTLCYDNLVYYKDLFAGIGLAAVEQDESGATIVRGVRTEYGGVPEPEGVGVLARVMGEDVSGG